MFRFGTAAVLCTIAWAGIAAQPGAYDVTARTEMPNLEENLRYATTRERRCLHAHELASVFPVLQHPSLEGCKLAEESRHGDAIRYRLVCANPGVATGAASLDSGPDRVAGVLEVKMGGKNMRFAQRVEAVRRGECEPAP